MSDSLQPHGLQHARLPCLHYLPDSDLLKSTSIDWANDTIWPSHPLQYFGHLMQRANSLEKVLMLGKIGGKRRSGWQRVRKMLSSELGTVAQSCLTLCNPSLYAWTAACQASLSITNPRVYSVTGFQMGLSDKMPSSMISIVWESECNKGSLRGVSWE